MSVELDQLLLTMLVVALKYAGRVPTPSEPPDDAWEQAADDFCYRFARTNEAEQPSPEVASALIPRLRIARVLAGTVEHAFAKMRQQGDASATEREMLEWLLVSLWHSDWKARWLAGEIE